MFVSPIENIIVGVDFSTYSKIVVKQAKKLAVLWKAQLIVVHAIHDPLIYSPILFVPVPAPLTELQYKRRIVKEYNLNTSKVKVIAVHGDPTALLNKMSIKFRYSMIVIGYKGHNKIAEFFFGGTAQSLIQKSKVPLWVHRGNRVIMPEKILIPHDLSKESNRSIDLFKQLSLKPPFNYEVMFVRERPFPVLDYKSFKSTEKQQLKDEQQKIQYLLAKYPRLPFFTTTGNVTEKIVKRTNQFDMIIMAHHNPDGLFARNESIRLLQKTNKPLLIV